MRIEWTIFYRILEIPDEITAPNYYQLLGVEPEVCTAELLMQSLNERKMRLRQNIPGPHFIPLVLKFEQENLEPAAATLSDSEKRQEYDQRLQESVQQPSAAIRKAYRASIIRKGRELVLAALNDEGSISEENRSVLGGQLQRLGFSQGDIRVLFEGIPTVEALVAPSHDNELEFFVNAVRMAVSGGLLDNSDELKLMNMAKHLSLSCEESRLVIEKQLSESKAHRGEKDVALLEKDFIGKIEKLCSEGIPSVERQSILLAEGVVSGLSIESARIILNGYFSRFPPANGQTGIGAAKSIIELPAYAGPASGRALSKRLPLSPILPKNTNPYTLELKDIAVLQSQAVTASGPTPEEPSVKSDSAAAGSDRQEFSGKLFFYLLSFGIPALAITIFTLLFMYQTGNYGKREREKPGGIDFVERQDKSAISTEPQPDSVAEKTDPDSDAQIKIPVEPGPTDYSPGHVRKISGTIETLRNSYSRSSCHADLLGDIALTMLALRDSAAMFVGTKNDWSGKLFGLLEMKYVQDRNSYMVGDLFLPMLEPEQFTLKLGEAKLAEIREILLSDKSVGLKYHAIEQLRLENTAGAGQFLVDILRDKKLNESKVVHRILGALREMDAALPGAELVKVLQDNPRRIVFEPVAQVLTEIYNIPEGMTPANCPGILPVRYDGRRQKQCALWWKNYYSYLVPGSAVNNPGGGNFGERNEYYDTLNPDDLAAIKLTLLAGDFARQGLELLETFNWNGQLENSDALGAASEATTDSEATVHLLTSVNGFADQCVRLVRQHPKGKDFSLEIDLVELRRQRRGINSKNSIQSIISELEATGELLEIMIRQMDPKGNYVELLEGYRRERVFSTKRVSELSAVRQSCYFNLILWDLILSLGK